MKSIVYFLIAQKTGMVKIGVTSQLKDRMDALQTACPVPLYLEAMLPGNRETEQNLHARFATSRSHGEWFRLTEDLMRFMDEIKAGKITPLLSAEGYVEVVRGKVKYKATPQQVFELAEGMWFDIWLSKFSKVAGVSKTAIQRWKKAAAEGRCIIPQAAFRALLCASDDYMAKLRDVYRQLNEPEPGDEVVIRERQVFRV